MPSPDRYPEYENARRNALDLDMRFFMHWSVLSAGTFSLLIPFVKSLNSGINKESLLTTGGVFLIISLICSVLGLCIVRLLGDKLVLSILGESTTNFKKVSRFKEGISSLILATYVTGIIFIAIFIKANIF